MAGAAPPSTGTKEGEEVVLSCPVNTPGGFGMWDNEIISWFVFSLWRISLTEMVQKHPACLCLQSDGSLQPARGFPDGQVEFISSDNSSQSVCVD